MLIRFELTKDGLSCLDATDVKPVTSIDYIKCKFTIKDNAWEGVQAIVAVFKSATYNKVSRALLDSDGCCYIDPSVFKHGGTILVKLYGDKYDLNRVHSTAYVVANTSFELSDHVVIPVDAPTQWDVFLQEYAEAKSSLDDAITDFNRMILEGDFKGDPGVGIDNIVFNNNYTMTINLTDGEAFDSPFSLRGPAGPTGPEGPQGPQGPPGADGISGAYHLKDGENGGSLRSTTAIEEGSNYMLGVGATAVGYNTKASGNYSHAEGLYTEATGMASHAEGTEDGSAQTVPTIASGTAAHAEGIGTTASGRGSHSEGNLSESSGENSHAEGHSTIASGTGAHAEGVSTVASGPYSHAEGTNTEASGFYAHAEGQQSVASGSRSHAQNLGTIAASAQQTAIGKFNVEDSNDTYAFIIGNGSSNSRSNAFTVAWDGSISLNGVTLTSAQLTSLLALI